MHVGPLSDSFAVLGKCCGTTQPSCATCSVSLALLKESWNTKGANGLFVLAEISGLRPCKWDWSSTVSHKDIWGLWLYLVQLWICFSVGRLNLDVCVAALHGCKWMISSAFWRTSVGTDQLPLVQWRLSVKAELVSLNDLLRSNNVLLIGHLYWK